MGEQTLSSVEQVDISTLKRLDLPKTAASKQGLDFLYLEKVLNLTYLVNDLQAATHNIDSKTATGITTNGQAFTAPLNSRYIIYSLRFTYICSATVGTRGIV